MPRKRKLSENCYQTPVSLGAAAGTGALPGTAEKIAEMARRVAAGQALFEPDDVESDPRRRLDWQQHRNGFKTVRGEAPQRPDPDEKVLHARKGYYAGLGRSRVLR